MTVSLLIEQLKTIPDWRRGRAVQNPLWLMLLMTLLGVMSGYTSLRGLADFMLRHQPEVTEHFGLETAKLYRYSTIRDMAQDYGSAQNFVSVVSACVHGRADVMGQISFENGKTSEIGAVRDLLQQLDVVGVWFTMDALHCKKTVEQIVASKNNYCIGLKGNQPTLFRQAQRSAQTQEPLSQYYEKDRSKGRQVERQVELFSAPPEAMTQWSGSNRTKRIKIKST